MRKDFDFEYERKGEGEYRAPDPSVIAANTARHERAIARAKAEGIYVLCGSLIYDTNGLPCAYALSYKGSGDASALVLAAGGAQVT